MAQRGVSIDLLESTLAQTPFRYFHEGIWKTGYYDPHARIFAATDGSKVATVVNNVTPNYIRNLVGLGPAQ
jgi:hypothetical protein